MNSQVWESILRGCYHNIYRIRRDQTDCLFTFVVVWRSYINPINEKDGNVSVF